MQVFRQKQPKAYRKTTGIFQTINSCVKYLKSSVEQHAYIRVGELLCKGIFSFVYNQNNIHTSSICRAQSLLSLIIQICLLLSSQKHYQMVFCFLASKQDVDTGSFAFSCIRTHALRPVRQWHILTSYMYLYYMLKSTVYNISTLNTHIVYFRHHRVTVNSYIISFKEKRVS